LEDSGPWDCGEDFAHVRSAWNRRGKLEHDFGLDARLHQAGKR
jgi:hypothetical protein